MSSTSNVVRTQTVQVVRDKREIRGQIVLDLLQDYDFVTMLPPNKEIYVYDNRKNSKTYGIWRRELAEKIIVERVERVLGLDATRYDKKEVISKIKDRTYHNLSNDALFWESSPKNLICLANGVLDINTGKLMEHSPDYRFLAKVPVEYIPRDDPRLKGKDRIDKFLHEILLEEKDVEAQYEWAGYCLYRSYPIHKSSLLVGEGANGKSTLINVLVALLGEENVANVSLQSLCKNRFAIANLQGKLADMHADLSAKALRETGVFKMLTGGDVIDAERKFVQGRVKFVNHAKLIFSCNQIPPVMSDDTTAFWRRWNITKFPRVFDEENADKKILEKLTQPLELSSLLNNALDGLKRLLQNGRFSNYKNVEETRADYILKSDPIWAFAEQKLVMESDSYEPKMIVYEAYKKFCRRLNLPIAPSNVFSRSLRTYITFRDGQRTVDGKKGITCYCGIKLVDKENETEEDSEGLAPWVKESEMDMGKRASDLAIKQGESQKKAEESRINGSLPTFYGDEERFKVSTADTQIEETKHCIYCHEEVNEDEKPPDKIAINLDGKHKRVVVHLSCLRAHLRNSPKMCVFCGKQIVDHYEGNHGFYTAILHDGRFAHTRCCDARRIGYTSDTGCNVQFVDKTIRSIPIFGEGEFLSAFMFICNVCNKPIREGQKVLEKWSNGFIYHRSCCASRLGHGDRALMWSKDEEERNLNIQYMGRWCGRYGSSTGFYEWVKRGDAYLKQLGWHT